VPIDPWTCVSLSSPLWRDEKNGFLLWQAMDKNDILFSPASPILAIDPTSGKFSASATLLRDSSGALSGGSVSFCVDTAATGTPANLVALQNEWTQLVTDPHNTSTPPPDVPAFRSLTMQNAQASLDIDPLWGAWSDSAHQADAGTPGGLLAFSINLTKDGALAFQRILSQPKTSSGHGAAVPGTLNIKYQYLRLIPECKVHVKIHGDKLFQALSAALDASGSGVFFGGSVAIRAAWQQAKETGAIEIIWDGGAPPPNLGVDPNKLLQQFLDQALKAFFDQIFKPAPQVETAKAGTTHGLFGGANFALNWTQASDAMELSLDMSFNGATWLEERMDTTLGALFSNLDSSYIAVIDEQVTVYVSAMLLGAPHVSGAAFAVQPFVDGTAVSMPTPLVATGPSATTVVSAKYTATDPKTLRIDTTLTVDYDAGSALAPLTINNSYTGSAASVPMVNPGAWMSSLTLDLRIIDANGHVIPDSDPANDFLNVNVTFAGTTPPLPAGAGVLTVRMPLLITWTKQPDGSDPATLTLDANGQLLTRAVSQSGIAMQAGLHTLFYEAASGTLTFKPALAFTH